ncbi:MULTISPECIES: restriction endonuclease subunit S [Halomonas]|uniref:restriction endonuclease subunit S n=1 Tax=Halomonas TaxID=2745 RepID=UPI0018674CB3|nr:restriction endonuclease subunit S [Halomonas citrativorans]
MEVNGLPIVKLGEILPASYKNGIYKNSESYGSGTPILRITDFNNDGNLVNRGLRRLELSPKEIKGYQLQRDDIVVNRVNSLTHLGKAVLWRNERGEEVVYESNMMRIEPNPSVVLPEFLIRVLQSHNARSHFRKVAKRAVAQCSISQQDVKSLTFPLPPLPEQKKIALILTTWDQAITATERLLENSQQRKKGLMQQLLTGKKRMPGYEEEWESKHISQTGKIVSGGTPDTNDGDLWGGDVQWLTPTDITALKTHFIYDTPRKITEKGVTESSATLMPSGSLCVCTRASVGLMAISTTPITTNQGFKSVIPNNKHDVEFLYYLFSFNRHVFIRYSSGSTFMELSKKDFVKIIFNYPPVAEQKAIARILASANNEIEQLQKRINHLKQEKKALMQQLLTGKRRVQVEAA